jgi:anti-anti-sigma factor
VNDLTIRTRSVRSGPVVELTGDLDHETAPQVRAHLPHLTLVPGQFLVVDLGGVTFCDSSGITVLLAARHHALQSDRIFRVVGLEQVFATHPTVEAAAAAWEPPDG